MSAPVLGQISEKLRPSFQQRPEIRFAYLFGSLARGTDNRMSDVDLAVFLDRERFPAEKSAGPYGYRAALIAELMQVLGTSRVDVVVLNDAVLFLKFQVVRYGVPIYEADHLERVRFQAETFSRYFDLKPFLEVSRASRIFG
jgi:predicted nucleotidyltransferase